MAYLSDISTAVPEYQITQESILNFFCQSLPGTADENFCRKVKFLSTKSGINTRYSCIPDFGLESFELYTENNFKSRTEQRMRKYAEKIVPFAGSAVSKLFDGLGIKNTDITHLITVSCTGMTAPGFEIKFAEAYNLRHCEKLAINYMGCYAALKGLKCATHIANSVRGACVLVVCAEICSLHYNPPMRDEDIIASLLFGDGAAAALVCSEGHPLLENKTVFRMNDLDSALIPESAELMTWDVGSSGFKMHLDKGIAGKIGESIQDAVKSFLEKHEYHYYAVHPGGVRILQEVRDALGLPEESLRFSWDTLRNFGNMSSPTILFILEQILGDIRSREDGNDKNIFTCAFGPGITVEMIGMSSVSFFGKEFISTYADNAV